MTDPARTVTGGDDTHKDTHVAAALDELGRVLGTESFPATAAGYQRLLAWLGCFGEITAVGIEGTGTWGAGLARALTALGVRVLEVQRPNRQHRRRHGKSDPADALSAARTVQAGEANGTPKAPPAHMPRRLASRTTARAWGPSFQAVVPPRNTALGPAGSHRQPSWATQAAR
jgi:transposase